MIKAKKKQKQKCVIFANIIKKTNVLFFVANYHSAVFTQTLAFSIIYDLFVVLYISLTSTVSSIHINAIRWNLNYSVMYDVSVHLYRLMFHTYFGCSIYYT